MCMQLCLLHWRHVDQHGAVEGAPGVPLMTGALLCWWDPAPQSDVPEGQFLEWPVPSTWGLWTIAGLPGKSGADRLPIPGWGGAG